MTALPAPLVPAEVDLRDFAFMPLDVQRLRDSDLASDETPEACWAAVLLWCASWHQLPAGSIPDSDDWQAKHAGYKAQGRIAPSWKRVRNGALRGWVPCSDGRLYHPVVAEKALESWRHKLAQRWRSEVARIKKHNQRHGTIYEMPDLDTWISLGCPLVQTNVVHKDISQLSPGQVEHVPGETPSNRPDRTGPDQTGIVEIPSKLSLAPASPPEKPPQLTLVGDVEPEGQPDCPHQAVLALWAEVLPAMPQHLPAQWKGVRADHLRARWRETAAEKGWRTPADGLAYLRKFFGYVGRSAFLTGRESAHGKRPFFVELEWLVRPANWAKVQEGKYHPEKAA